MQMIWAVIRASKVDDVVKTLQHMGVTGCTVSSVKGYEREWHLYEVEIHGEFKKLEVIAEDERVEEIGRGILEAAWTGLKGDGVLAILDLRHAVKIRFKQWAAEFPRIGERP